jgi:hypothetical protein
VKHDEQRLRRAMEDHEYLAPHPGAVYARVQLLAQIYRRRRFLVHSTSGVLLSAGLLAGLVQMHGFIQGEIAPPPVVPGAAESAPPPSPSAPRPPSALSSPPETEPAWPDDPELAAYFGAGYDWNDAERLARLWKLDDPTDAKTKAGARILAGKDVPLRPGRG